MLAKPVGRLMITAARRGLLGGSRSWLVLLVLLAGGRVLRRIGGRSGWSLSLSERLEVGDRIEITSLPSLEMGR
ncbi:uncharacterized protein METZ01_LOCUS457653 [marine metagenome]|uniref:Uncharacterized protein n=1 Tax=marine metagenome TaxID=408172 RepID=A0A383AB64_9ZZZZ